MQTYTYEHWSAGASIHYSKIDLMINTWCLTKARYGGALLCVSDMAADAWGTAPFTPLHNAFEAGESTVL